MELLWAWSRSKDPEMKVATSPHQLLWGEEVTVHKNGSCFLMSIISEKERNEREERGWEAKEKETAVKVLQGDRVLLVKAIV